jgi:hypothetical protein
MQFLLFDVSATCVFLLGYLAVSTLWRRRAQPVLAATSRGPGTAQRPAPPRQQTTPRETQKERPTEQCCREWPRLSAPR